MSQEPPVEVTPMIYRIAASTVLIGVKDTERGPEPLFTDVSGEPCAVAYTDPEDIRRDLPDGYRLFQIQVPELLAQLPPVCGLVINPRAASPLHVTADEREVVIAAGLPFPPGAPIRIRAGAEQHPTLLPLILDRVAAIGALRRLYCTRYRVADAREKILFVYDNDGVGGPDVGADRAVNDTIIAAAAEINLADPIQIIAVDDIPETFRRMVLADVEPCYVRPDLRG